MTYLLYLAIILFFAKVGGMITKRFNQPEVLGQILIGIALGFFLKKTELITSMGEIGVILLMFVAGLETDVNQLKESKATSSLVAIFGVAFPFVLVGGAVYLFTGNLLEGIFMGIVSTATSVSISVQTLREISMLRSKQGVTILGAAIIDDVIGILLLTVMIGITSPQAGSSVTHIMLNIAALTGIVVLTGFIIVKLFKKYYGYIERDHKNITLAIVMSLILAFVSEELGVAAITGSYFAGVIFSLSGRNREITYEVNKIATFIFTPLFFVGIGMSVDLAEASHGLKIGLILIVFGFLGKVLGCGLGAKLLGSSKRESLQIGLGMVPRAEVAIIVANLGVKLDIISKHQLSAVIVLVLATTIITPPLLKMSFRENNVHKTT